MALKIGFISNKDVKTMFQQLSKKEQFNIIKKVDEEYSKFLDPDFDASAFLECRDNFALTTHIESVKIFEMDNVPTNPTFTIAIPTYNRCETLREAINSAINQKTNEEYEIIVLENVDDFDKKTTAQQILECEYKGKLTYYKNRKNIGIFGNHNRCLTLAKGRWVCILHDDDLITEDYIEKMKKTIYHISPTTILIGCLEETFGKNKKMQDISSSFLTYYKNSFFAKMLNFYVFRNTQSLFFHHQQRPLKFLSPSAVLHNKQGCIRIGGYNSDEFPIGDNFFHTRAYYNGGIATLMEKLQFRGSDINEGLSPVTQLKYCYLTFSFYKKFVPHQTWQYVAYSHIDFIKNHMVQDTEVKNFISERFLTKLDPKKRLFWIGFYKTIFIMKNLIRCNKKNA